MGTVNTLFGPTAGDKVVVFAASCLRKIGQKQRFLFAHLYSNLFGVMLRTNNKEQLIQFTKEMTASLQTYNDSFALEPAFGIYEIKMLRQSVEAFADKDEKHTEDK